VLRKGGVVCLSLLLAVVLLSAAEAVENNSEASIQASLENSRNITNMALGKLKRGVALTDEIDRLKSEADKIRAAVSIFSEGIQLKGQKALRTGAKATGRHQSMISDFRKTLEEYLVLISSLPAQENVTIPHLEAVFTFLDRNVRTKKRPIFGSLPYRNLNYPLKAPTAQQQITPAYRGGNIAVNPDDLKSTSEAPVSPEIAKLAEKLNWNPVSIYEYLKNNIETEWYWGCMKGAEETLRQKSGNDCDQATLLVALLRASNYPSRYVRGVIEIPTGDGKLINIVGAGDNWGVAALLQKAGIPNTPVISAGGISSFQIEHIWVETQVPYANYRGAIADDNGKTWIALDTSIKIKGYQYNSPADIYQNSAISSQLTLFREQYLGSVQTQTPLAYLKTRIAAAGSQQTPQLTVDDYMLKRTLVHEVLNILPAGLQFKDVIIGEYAAIPDELIHKARFTARPGGAQGKVTEALFDLTLPVYSLSSQSLALRYEPETVEDQEIINSYGGLSNTPAYLVRLRPTLTLNGNLLVAGKDGIAMGEDCLVGMELISPNGSGQIVKTHVTGNLSVIGIVAQQVVTPVEMAAEDKDAERLMYEEALKYLGQWNKTEDELSSLLRVTAIRPSPAVVTIGGVINVSYLLDKPSVYNWKGVFIDANYKAIETVDSGQQSAVGNQQAGGERQKQFMTLSALHGSILENRIFEDDFHVRSVSTAKLFQVCTMNPVPCTRKLVIDKTNIDTILPTLPFDDNMKQDIQNSVNQNLTVTMPVPVGGQPADIPYEDWAGIGYIKENPDTGEAGYMMSGMIAGGMTVWTIDKWEDYFKRLGDSDAEPPNQDPLSATRIQKVSATDLQFGVVGTVLEQPLTVRITDKEGQPVTNSEIVFKVKAGMGSFVDASVSSGASTITVKSDAAGLARVKFKLGMRTKENPAFMLINSGDKYSTQVGENLIEASIKASGVSTPRPFTAYGKPGEPKVIKKGKYNALGIINSWNGFISAILEDEYGNPVSNAVVHFTALTGYTPENVSSGDTAMLVSSDDSCLVQTPFPTTGKCSSQSAAMEVATNALGSAIAHVILGSKTRTKYPFKAEYNALSADYIMGTLYCGVTGANCGGLSYEFTADYFGNNISAGSPGNSLPIYAKVFALNYQPSGGNYVLDPDPPATVTVSGNQAAKVSSSGGVYLGAHLLTAGVNQIPINATITHSDNNKIDYTTTATAYGVQIQIGKIPIIPVDGDGYAAQDTAIVYAITPGEYVALTAFMFILKDGQPVAYIPIGLQGSGSATLAKGFQFDSPGVYEAQAVLNAGTEVEIRSGKDKIVPDANLNAMSSFGVDRSHHRSRFDSGIEPTVTYTDSYRDFSFSVAKQSTASLKIYDINMNEQGTIISSKSLPPGDYNFVVDYETIRDAGFLPSTSAQYTMVLEVVPADGSNSTKNVYVGKIAERANGAKLLGQTIVHDVQIQDGALMLNRRDMELKGRGPQLNFSRSYTNQSTGSDYKPMGEGWGHSLDMKLHPLSSNDRSVPDWVNSLKGRFYTNSEKPPTSPRWMLVSVNGTTFIYKNNRWNAERGRHGSLEEAGDSLIYTSKDGTRYTYKYPYTYATPVQSIKDRNGNTMQFKYDDYGRLAEVTDAVDRKLIFGYDYFGANKALYASRLVKVTGPDGIELVFKYNNQGYLTSAERGARVEKYDYKQEPGIIGADYNLVKVTDANEHSYEYIYYDNTGKDNPALLSILKYMKWQDVVKTVKYPDTYSAGFTYEVTEGSNRRIVGDMLGYDTTYILNTYGNPIQIDEPLGRTTKMTWSIDEGKPDNVMTSKTDGRLNTTSYEYDANGNIVKETDPYGKQIIMTWNNFGQPLTRLDRNNVSQGWDYDGNGNLLKYTDGDSKVTNYTNYTTGERWTMTDPRQNTTRYTYDKYGNPAMISGPEGSLTNLVFDIRGRRVSVTDPRGKITEYKYDNLDYPSQIIHPAITAYNLPSGSGRIQSFVYDPVGNLLSETNRNGLTLAYTYTPRNQVETITRNVGGVKTFKYDANGNLLSETDWKGVATSHRYNELNQRVTTINRLGYTMAMGYDLSGNLNRVTDYENRTTYYEFDKLNRLTDITQPLLTGQTLQGVIHYDYYNEADPKTNLWRETDQEANTTTYEYNGRYLRTKRINANTDIYTWAYDDKGNLSSETDEEGKTTGYEYDKQNRRTFMRKKLGGRTITTEYKYDANGNQIYIIDPRTNTTETRYDEWNRAYQVIDADTYSTTTGYDGEGNKVKVTDGNNHTRTWERDARGLVTRAVDAETYGTQYTYDANGNVETVINAVSATTRNTYDAEDRLKTATEALGTEDQRTKEIVTRDGMGNPLKVMDYNGNVSVMTYNALNLPERVYDPAPFDAQYVEKTYYRTGKVKDVRNRRGYHTKYQYDKLNREWLVTDPKNKTIETKYTKVGKVKSVKDKREILTENFYDDLHRLWYTTKDNITLVTNEYDDAGNLAAVTDANRNRVENTYNNRNLLAVTKYPDTTTSSRTYDGVGNLKTLTDEAKKVTTYGYDKENRQTSVEFANEKTEKTYDPLGNLQTIKKPLGNIRRMDYDWVNRPALVTDDFEGFKLKTSFQYDANGNLLSQYDARGKHVEFTYDKLNRKKSHIQHKASGNLVTVYDSYDEEGNLTAMTDAKGQRFLYQYDELNRKTDTTYQHTELGTYRTDTIHIEYDANNNITFINENKAAPDGVGFTDSTSNIYDNFDRLKTSAQRGLTISYDYDANGNRTYVSTPAGSTTYTYTNRNRIDTAVTTEGTTRYTYYPDGKKDTITHPNGASVKYTYSPANRVETITHKTGNSVISSYAYTYDANGNRLSQLETQGGVTETTTYHYDTLDRLKDFTISGANTTFTEYTYEGYNRKTERETVNGTVVKDRVLNYDETDWLVNIQDSGKTISYTYDNNGNTITKTDSSLPNGDFTFTYDARDRLVQTKRGPPGSETLLGQYDYNSLGLRVRHRYSDRGSVDYYYDGSSVIEERSGNSLLAHYRYADRLLSLNTGTETQYYHHDALGSTVNLTTTSGGVQTSYSLDPWGHIRRQSGLSVNRRIFTGQEHDENTGLIYFGARYYDPDTARFMSQDSYLGESNVPPSLNRYLYAYSNPTVYIDLLGYASTMDSVTDYLNGIAEADRQEVVELNKDLKQQTFEVEQDRRATMAGKAIKAGALRLSAGVLDMLGSGVDNEIAGDLGMVNTTLGQEARQRLDETNEAAVKTGKAIKQIAAKLTSEEGSAMVDSAKVSIGNSMRKIFIEGDLVAGFDFISGVTEVGVGLALGGIGTSGKVKQAGKTTVEVAEEMTAAGKNAKTVETVAARSEAAAADTGENIVYRALNSKDVARLEEGFGLEAKNPSGSWNLGEHITFGSSKSSWANDPWIATTRELEVAKSFDSGKGLVAIDLNKVSSTQLKAWEIYPRVNGAAGLPYHYSIWQQEISIYQNIPREAIRGYVK
jgi:RHS repeat-associated protein